MIPQDIDTTTEYSTSAAEVIVNIPDDQLEEDHPMERQVGPHIGCFVVTMASISCGLLLAVGYLIADTQQNHL